MHASCTSLTGSKQRQLSIEINKAHESYSPNTNMGVKDPLKLKGNVTVMCLVGANVDIRKK
jgi:hypothetical protein